MPTILRRKSSAQESSILWDSSLFFFGLGIPVLFILNLVDSSEINSEPRWIKPLKFFVSIIIYNFTLEWIYRVFRTDQNVFQFNRFRWVIALGLLIEAILIVSQSARGVQSHFNVATTFDGLIFATMGIVITIVATTVLFSGITIWKGRKLAPPVFVESLFLGLIIMTLASFQGFTMTEPNSEQAEAIEQGVKLDIEGSHFVGELPSEKHRTFPFTGWSLDVGDLRISHFIGLHALQVFLVLGLLLSHFRVSAPLFVIRSFALFYGGLFLYTFLRAQAGAALI